MSYELIITEKPSAAEKIAQALADTTAKKISDNGVPYYTLKHNGKEIVVTCAAGHLYTVTESEKKGWTYPVFDIKWEASSKVSKDAAFNAKFLSTIKKLAKDAKEFTIATDFDIEGEVIGYNVLKYACKQKDGKRMKYSTLTKDELVESYEHASKHLIWGQVHAGITRHELDWYYGINLSRALTLAVKNAKGGFKLLSIGRVQGPSLKIVVDKEKEIKAFIPTPYWQLQLDGDKDSQKIEALHEKDKFLKKEEAESSLKKTKGQKAIVKSVEKNEFKQTPPNPFDLTSLQLEAHKTLGIAPKNTLEIAQSLYLDGLISYPRTSSQKLPPSIGYKKIITNISKNPDYKIEAEAILKKPVLHPHDGPKVDEAHPAIYPTGISKKLNDREARLYDLVVRRFLATFGDSAKRETMTIKINVNGEVFVTNGTRTVEKGWHLQYGRFTMLKDEELPKCEIGNEIKIKKIELLSKETAPPRRYTAASIIKELEKRNLGTKSTRAQIIDNLYQRGYVNEKSIEATELGIKTVDILTKYSPQILDDKLTRHFENEMEAIRKEKMTREKVIEEAKKVLTEILKDFKTKEKKIGAELLEANKGTISEMTSLGSCPECKEGTIQIRKGKFGAFAACNKYPECKTTFNLPKSAILKPLKKNCETCNYPMIQVFRKRQKPQELCINPKCPTKKPSVEEAKEIKKIENLKVAKKCPKCGKDLILRTSFYGKFFGCTGFPACRHTEKLIEDVKKEVPAVNPVSTDNATPVNNIQKVATAKTAEAVAKKVKTKEKIISIDDIPEVPVKTKKKK